jgi:hypothetical protein
MDRGALTEARSARIQATAEKARSNPRIARVVGTVVVAFLAWSFVTGSNDATSGPDADNTPRSWTDGWEAASGDCDRGLPYGYSAVLVRQNPYMEASYKGSYYDGYLDSWHQGVSLGYCEDSYDTGVARGAEFLPVR